MSENADLIGSLRKVGNLHEFAELFGFDWEDASEWTWHDVAVKMAETIDAWNKRTELTCHDYNASAREHGAYLFMWRCSNCGESYDTEMDKPNYCPNCGAKVVSE